MAPTIEIRVNSVLRKVESDPARSLLDVLREDLELTGTKYGCGEGQCGACTVHVNGTPMRSCVVRIGEVAGKEIRTIEGLAPSGSLHPLQEAFLEVGAFQCAYCTAGMIMRGAALLASNTKPSDLEIAAFMQGNICRCCTYTRIVAAVRKAAAALNGGGR